MKKIENQTETQKIENQTETQKIENQTETQKIEKQLKKALSETELSTRLELAKTHKNEIVKFLCTKTQTWTIGLIRTARLDKRSGFIQFRIEELIFPLPDEDIKEFENPTGTWINPDGSEECPVRRTGIIWGKGDDSSEIKLEGHYNPIPKPSKTREQETKETPEKEVSKPKPKAKSKASKKQKIQSPEQAAMAAAMADMAAAGVI